MQTSPSKGRYGKGRGAGWAKLRKRVMDRDKWLCQVCARAGRLTVATECDHVIPLCQQGPTEESNLQAICGPCHLVKSKREANGGKDVRVIVGCDADGWPRPV